jgi:pimeloyl-ACP methyl ester carboxylesterase
MGKRGGEAVNRIVFGKTPIHPAAVAYMNAIMTHFKPRVGNLPLFTDAELGRLTSPVMLMAGEQDALYPQARIAARVERLLPHAHVLLEPGMGHVLYGVTEKVMPFLTS